MKASKTTAKGDSGIPVQVPPPAIQMPPPDVYQINHDGDMPFKVDPETGEIMDQEVQLSLFDGQQVDFNTYKVKAANIGLFDEEGRIKDGIKLGGEIRISCSAKVVKVSAGRKDGFLIRTHTLEVSDVSFEGFTS